MSKSNGPSRKEIYSKKLRDPRWQRKRLEIMERDSFTCQSCYDNESTLNVHHTYYEYGNDPWDYPEGSLITLCERCHEIETKDGKHYKDYLVRQLCTKGFLSGHMHAFANIIAASDFFGSGGGNDPRLAAFEYFMRSEEAQHTVHQMMLDEIREKVFQGAGAGNESA